MKQGNSRRIAAKASDAPFEFLTYQPVGRVVAYQGDHG